MGRVRGQKQMGELQAARKSLTSLQVYAAAAGVCCRPLVQLLLSKGVDPISAIDGTAFQYSSLAGLTPLHLLACSGPGAAALAESLDVARQTPGSERSPADVAEIVEMARTVVKPDHVAGWVKEAYADHIAAARDLLQPPPSNSGSGRSGGSSSGGNSGGGGGSSGGSGRVAVNVSTQELGETPLCIAAAAGALEIAELLLAAGADPDDCRSVDAARPLDLAVAKRNPAIGCLLIEHGAEVVPGPDHHMFVLDNDIITPPNLQPKMLLLNAVDCSGLTDDVRLLQLLLQHGVREQQIERHRLDLEVSNDRGETALLAAVRKGRAEMVQLLVDAGAYQEATLRGGSTPGSRPACSRMTALVGAAATGQLDVMQILLDAGADCIAYINEQTGYDIVQNTANAGQFEAVVKLVEAGASWRLSRGQPRVVRGNLWYVPEILCCVKPGLK
ncbi:hypothetical protein OEZ85_005812 [Tetradesmus obliquus]|uniref:Uncharacterized protein n=1 Tax=Tetradesmus obliquus TaxID=3088 RepID=A0ABY8UHX4_TETOB|nr:hypothetical protein OEZ85_005812 [Tetradesmus obliquus]